MTKQEITDKVIKIICNNLKIEKKEIFIDSSFNSFGIDSLDIVDIIDDVEKEFKIIIPDKIAFKLCTINSIVDCVTSVADYIHNIAK